jgi:hypothetical protein
MLALVSEQAIPNVMAALLVEPRPRALICILPEDTRNPGRIDTDFRTVFNGISRAVGMVAPDISVINWASDEEGQPVSPYSSEQVKAACSAIRTDPRFAAGPWIYNVTGGTKLMAQAALDDARRSGCRAMYVDTDSRRVIWDGNRPVGFDESRLTRVGVREYLTAYGVSVTRHADSVSPDLRRAAYEIGKASAGPSLMKQIKGDRTPTQDCDQAVYLPSETLSKSARDLLFQVFGLLSNRDSIGLQERPNGLELTVWTGDEALREFFWSGRWLECYVFDTVCRLLEEDLEVDYSQPWRNVLLRWAGIEFSGLPEIKGLQGAANELDVAATRGARLLVCECKTGKHVLDSDHLYKLQVIGHKLGAFADKVLVTDGENLLDPSNRSTRQGVVRALTLNTVVIQASQLPGLGKLLADPDRELRRQKQEFKLRA